MRSDTKSHRCLMHLVDSGYWVSPKGEVYNPSGSLVKQQVKTDKKSNYNRYTVKVKDPVSKTSFPVTTAKLVAVLKYGEGTYLAADCVRHLNGNSLDNSYENIAIGSHSDNMMDQPKEVRRSRATHAISSRSDLIDWNPVVKDRKLGMSYKQLALKHNITQSSISYHFKTNSDPLGRKAIHPNAINWEGPLVALSYGLTIKEASTAYKIAEATINKRLYRSGIKTKRGKVVFA